MGENAKYDQGKNRLDLVFPSIIEELGKVRTYGVQKYKDPDNWRRIDDAKTRYTAAAMRHFEAWRKGEMYDPESGIMHLSHCACNLMFIIELIKMEEVHACIDDRIIDTEAEPIVDIAPVLSPEEEKFTEILKDYDLVAKLTAAIERKKEEAAKEEENKEDKE